MAPIPDRYLVFIERWKELYPDFFLKIWSNDDIFGLNDDIISHAWASTEYDEANISNRMRLLIINRFGGIYADVDTKPIRNMSEVIGTGERFVIGKTQFLYNGEPAVDMNLFYAPANNNVIIDTLFNNQRCNGSRTINRYLVDKHRNEMQLCPVDYFQGVTITPSTYSLHWPHRMGSWMRTKHDSHTRT